MAASSPAPQRVTTRDALANVSRNKYIPCPLSLRFFLFFWISCSSTLRLLYSRGVMAKCPFLRWFSPRPASLDILPVMRSHLWDPSPILSMWTVCLCFFFVPYGMSMAPCLLVVLPSVGYFFPAGHICLSYAQVVTAIQFAVSDAFVNHRAFHHILVLCWFNVSSYLVPASYHYL
jgi:hypothetical protein